MVDNPFFPGYKPKYEGETSNPLYPGYTAGQKPYRPYSANYLGKFEYKADEWLDQLDQMSLDVGNLPKWVLNQYLDDFKKNLRARYSPEDTPIEQIDDYDQDVLPGVADISLTLDPFEWKDPKKVLEKTAKDWIKAGTGLRFKKEGWGLEAWPIDLTDYDNRVKTTLWKAAMGLQEEISPIGRAGGEAIAAATRARGGEPGGGIFNFRDADYVVAGKKGYETMAYNAVEVQRYMQAPQKRDGKHDSFVASMASAINEEINGEYEVTPTVVYDKKGDPVRDKDGNVLYDLQKKEHHYYKKSFVKDDDGDIILDNTVDIDEIEKLDDLKGYIKKKGNKVVIDKHVLDNKEIDLDSIEPLKNHILYEQKLYGNRKALFSQLFDNEEEAKNFEKAAVIFENKTALASDMGSFHITGRITTIQKQLRSRLGGSKNAEDRGDTLYAGGTKTIFEKNIEELKKNINERLAEGGAIDRWVENVRKIDKASAAALQKHADEYKQYLQKLQETLNTYSGNDRLLLNKLANLNVNGRALTGGELANPSIQRSLLRQIDADITLAGKISGVDKKYQLGTYLGKIEQLKKTANKEGKTLQDIFEEENQYYTGFFANQARLVASRLEEDRASYAIEEFYDAITQGQFLERYVWNRLAKRITGYTPGEIAQKGLSKVGYFGLVIDDNQVSEGLRNSALFNAVFRNKFTLALDNSEKIFDSNKKIVKAIFRGSKDLAIINTIGETLSSIEHLENNDILKLLTGTDPSKIDKFWDKVPPFWRDPHFQKNLQNQIANFQKWLAENGAALGITLKDFSQMDDTERKRLLALFNALNKENKYYGSLKITKEFTGMIQRIGVGLNKLQDKIFGFEVFQKIIRPVLQMRTIVAEKISEVVATIIASLTSKALAALTGGTTALLTKLIEKVLKPLIRFIVRKTVEFAQNFLGALAQGDISRAMAQVDKELQNLIRFSLYLIGIPILVVYVFLYGVFGTVLNTFSPIDPTRDNAGYGGPLSYEGLPQGENALIKIEKDVIVNGETNPTTGLPNGQPLSVSYKIRVTPKVDIPDTKIIINDTVSRVYRDSDSLETVVIKEWKDYEVASSFVAGETTEITLTLPNQLIYSDSLIKNELSVTTPAYESEPEDTVKFTRYFRIGTPPSSMGCFEFAGPDMNGNFEMALQNALIEIESKGAFLSKLCAENTWVIRYDKSVDFCGWAGNPGEVLFGGSCSEYYLTKEGTLSYLLAHELGHKFYGLFYKTLPPFGGLDGKTLPTYDLACGSSTNVIITEDFAETVGDFVRVNKFGDCTAASGMSYEQFWNQYPEHYQYATENIFN